MLNPGETIYLLEKDGVLLGRMPLERVEMFAIHCSFQPTPAFESFRALFDEDNALAEQLAFDDSPETLARSELVLEQVQALRLTLRREGTNQGYREFLLGIHGERADFRPLDINEEPL